MKQDEIDVGDRFARVTKSVGMVALSADYEVGVNQLRDAAANVL